ncbi:MAG TPA: hypothetical protein VG651_22365 [Stellaceae bacterium]|nr:hypothetical protein [Stellaceae bacterium]
MKAVLSLLFAAGLLLPAAALAEDAVPQGRGCGVVTGGLVAPGDGHAMIDCAGVSPEFAGQLAGILTDVLQRRLDPAIVVAKLGEVMGAPPGDAPRNLTADQGQALVQSLVGGKPAVITIDADPDGAEPGGYALAIATRLGMAGWRIEGDQIRRVVPSGLEQVRGLALAVQDDKTPPEKATQLKQAMAAAKIFLPLIAKADLPPNAALLWVGKRPASGDAPTR